jgi:cholestenol delta-isomerase
MSTTQHPYFPPGIRLSGDKFVANDWDVLTLIAAFGGGWALIAGVTLMVVKKVNPRLKGTDQALVLWFVLSTRMSIPFNAGNQS